MIPLRRGSAAARADRPDPGSTPLHPFRSRRGRASATRLEEPAPVCHSRTDSASAQARVLPSGATRAWRRGRRGPEGLQEEPLREVPRRRRAVESCRGHDRGPGRECQALRRNRDGRQPGVGSSRGCVPQPRRQGPVDGGHHAPVVGVRQQPHGTVALLNRSAVASRGHVVQANRPVNSPDGQGPPVRGEGQARRGWERERMARTLAAGRRFPDQYRPVVGRGEEGAVAAEGNGAEAIDPVEADFLPSARIEIAERHGVVMVLDGQQHAGGRELRSYPLRRDRGRRGPGVARLQVPLRCGPAAAGVDGPAVGGEGQGVDQPRVPGEGVPLPRRSSPQAASRLRRATPPVMRSKARRGPRPVPARGLPFAVRLVASRG